MIILANFCSNCGQQVEDSAEFCSKCGASLLTGAPHSQTQHIVVHQEYSNARLATILGLLYWVTFFSVFGGIYFAYKAKKAGEPADKVRTAMIVNWGAIIFTIICVVAAVSITLSHR